MSRRFNRNRNHLESEIAGSLEKNLKNLQARYQKKYDPELLFEIAHQEPKTVQGRLARLLVRSIK